MRAILLMTNPMEKVPNYYKTVHIIMGSLRMEASMGMEIISGQMVRDTKGIGQITHSMDMVSINGVMAENTSATGKIIKCVERDTSTMRMVVFFKELTETIRRTVQELIYFPTERKSWDIG